MVILKKKLKANPSAAITGSLIISREKGHMNSNGHLSRTVGDFGTLKN